MTAITGRITPMLEEIQILGSREEEEWVEWGREGVIDIYFEIWVLIMENDVFTK